MVYRLIHQPLQAGENTLSQADCARALGHSLPVGLVTFLAPTGAPASFEEDVRVKPC